MYVQFLISLIYDYLSSVIRSISQQIRLLYSTYYYSLRQSQYTTDLNIDTCLLLFSLLFIRTSPPAPARKSQSSDIYESTCSTAIESGMSFTSHEMNHSAQTGRMIDLYVTITIFFSKQIL